MTSRFALNNTAFKTVCGLGLLFVALSWPVLIGVAALFGVAFNVAISRCVRKELLITALTLLVGTGWAIAARDNGVVTFTDHASLLPPVWILSTWALFGSSLSGALRWMKVHWTLSAGLGFSVGLLSMSVLSLTGLLTLSYGGWSALAVGAAWAALFPILALLSDTIIDSSLFETPYAGAEYTANSDMTSLHPTH